MLALLLVLTLVLLVHVGLVLLEGPLWRALALTPFPQSLALQFCLRY